jgi:hypothetical protein
MKNKTPKARNSNDIEIMRFDASNGPNISSNNANSSRKSSIMRQLTFF